MRIAKGGRKERMVGSLYLSKLGNHSVNWGT
jgi:hypothetical protein